MSDLYCCCFLGVEDSQPTRHGHLESRYVHQSRFKILGGYFLMKYLILDLISTYIQYMVNVSVPMHYLCLVMAASVEKNICLTDNLKYMRVKVFSSLLNLNMFSIYVVFVSLSDISPRKCDKTFMSMIE